MKKINNILIVAMILTNTFFLSLTIFDYYDSNILVCLSFYLVIFIPKIIRKLKIKLADIVELVFLIFVFIAQLLGSIMHLYDLIFWFDSFAHYISGILTSFLGLILLDNFKMYDNKNMAFNIIYMLAITFMVAGIWEIFEFTCDNTLGYDAQKVIETGVADTMKDIICAFLGNILVSICYYYEIKQNKKIIINYFLDNMKN